MTGMEQRQHHSTDASSHISLSERSQTQSDISYESDYETSRKRKSTDQKQMRGGQGVGEKVPGDNCLMGTRFPFGVMMFWNRTKALVAQYYECSKCQLIVSSQHKKQIRFHVPNTPVVKLCLESYKPRHHGSPASSAALGSDVWFPPASTHRTLSMSLLAPSSPPYLPSPRPSTCTSFVSCISYTSL